MQKCVVVGGARAATSSGKYSTNYGNWARGMKSAYDDTIPSILCSCATLGFSPSCSLSISASSVSRSGKKTPSHSFHDNVCMDNHHKVNLSSDEYLCANNC